MKRNEMLKVLNNLRTSAALTVLSSEMAIECTYVSSQGFKIEWIPIDQWPAGIVHFADRDVFFNIIRHITDNNLEVNDIRETALWSIYMDWYGGTGDLNTLFAKLGKFSYPECGKLYTLCASTHIEFFCEYELFEKQFIRDHLSDCISWNSLDDEELEEWLERTRAGFDGIPCSEYKE